MKSLKANGSAVLGALLGDIAAILLFCVCSFLMRSSRSIFLLEMLFLVIFLAALVLRFSWVWH